MDLRPSTSLTICDKADKPYYSAINKEKSSDQEKGICQKSLTVGSLILVLEETEKPPTLPVKTCFGRKCRKIPDQALSNFSLKPIDSLSTVPNFKVGHRLLYDRFPVAYDTLMSFHDCSKLAATLAFEADSCARYALGTTKKSLRIADLGCGSGRLSLLLLSRASHLVCIDRSLPMLELCAKKLKSAAEDIDVKIVNKEGNPSFTPLKSQRTASLYNVAYEMLALPPNLLAECPCSQCIQKIQQSDFSFLERNKGEQLKPFAGHSMLKSPNCGEVDMVVCGWSLKFLKMANWKESQWHTPVYRAISAMVAGLDSVQGGTICIVETLGNFSDSPVRSDHLDKYLTDVLGFQKQWVPTNFKFRTQEEGYRLVTFFWGEKTAQKLGTCKDPTELKEWTGIWVRRFQLKPDIQSPTDGNSGPD